MKTTSDALASNSNFKQRLVFIALFAWLLLAVLSATNWVADAESAADPSAAMTCSEYTPNVAVQPDNSDLAPYIRPNFGTARVSVRVTVPQCQQGTNWEVPSSGSIHVTLPSYMSFASATPHPNNGGTITGSGQTVTYDHGQMNNYYPSWPYTAGVVFTINVNVPNSAADAPDWPPIGAVGVNSTYSYPTQGAGGVAGSAQIALYYSKMRATTTRTEPAYIGDEIPYTLTTSGYPHFPVNSSIVTITAPAHTEFVAGSHPGTVSGNQLTVDLGTISGASTINFNLRVLPTLTPTTRFFIPTYQHRLVLATGDPPRNINLSASLVENQFVYARPMLEMVWVRQGATVPLDGELSIKARLKNLSSTRTLTDVRLASGHSFQGEGLAQLVTPLPAGVILAPGETKEIEYRLKGTRAGKFTITGEGMARDLAENFRSIPATSPELCVGCSEVELEIEPPTKRLKVGDTFPVNVKVTSNMVDPTTITFADPVLKEDPQDDLPANAILTVESPELPEPFELTPDQPSRTFIALAKVNKLGVTDLVSSLTYTKPTGPPQEVEARKKIEVSPLLVTVQVTPRTTKLNQTPSSSKSERCRELEAATNGPKNCIELVATVKNLSPNPITNVRIPEATDPLKYVNETNPKLPGEPLRPLEATIPAGAFTLESGAEVTWTWRLDAFDAPAALEFEPVVYGVLNGAEISGTGEKRFTIIKNPLLKWGMKPAGGTAFTSGQNVRSEGYIKNISAEDGGEPEELLVMVYQIPKGNLGGGFVVPYEYSGETTIKHHFFNVPPEGSLSEQQIRNSFRTIKTGAPSGGLAGFGVRVWVYGDDGRLVEAPEQAELDEEGGYTDEFRVTLAAEPEVVNRNTADCLRKYQPIVCSFNESFAGEFADSMVGLYNFALEGGSEFGEGVPRMFAYDIKAIEQMWKVAVEGDGDAYNYLKAEAYAHYEILYDLGVLGYGAAKQTPEAFAVTFGDAVGGYMHAVAQGDLDEVQRQTGKFFGSNPDLLLEPIVVAGTVMRMGKAMKAARAGTADNILTAAARERNAAEAATIRQRLAAAKADPNNTDLSKALRAGDVLDEETLIEVFGVDQKTLERIEKIAKDNGVIMTFRSRSSVSQGLLNRGEAWPKPQALKHKTTNSIDMDYIGYRRQAEGKIEIVEPPASLKGKSGDELESALYDYMLQLDNARPELRNNKALRKEVRDRLKTRVKEWDKYCPQLDLENPANTVEVNVNFDAPMQKSSRDKSGDIAPTESRKIHREEVGTVEDVATGEAKRVWTIKIDGPGGQPPREVTGDIDFLAILDENGHPILDEDKRMAVYEQMYQAGLMEHGESMTFRMDDVRKEYLDCCVEGAEAMMTVGPWQGPPRAGRFVNNLSVMKDFNAKFKRVRNREVARKPSGEIDLDANGDPRWITIRMEDVAGEYALINGTPLMDKFDVGFEVRFQPLLFEQVYQSYLNGISLYFPHFVLKILGESNEDPVGRFSVGVSEFRRGGPILQPVPVSPIALRPPTELRMWTAQNGWRPATRDEAIAAGQPGVPDMAPFSVLRTGSDPGANTLNIALLDQTGATGDFFQPGDWIVLDPGGPNQETALIVGMNPLTLAAPLQHDHQVGEMVAWIEQPAAMASVSGAVRSLDGRGLANVDVALTDSKGRSRVVRTNTFGRFRFGDVPTGSGYILEAKSRRYRFPAQNLTVGGDLTDVTIMPLEFGGN